MTEKEHDPVKREESFREKSFHKLHFVVANDGAHDFNLTQETVHSASLRHLLQMIREQTG